MTRAQEVLLCHEYSQRLARSLLATKEKMKISGPYDSRVMYAWFGIPLELTKLHDARYVPCVMFLLIEENKTRFTQEGVQNLLSVLKSARTFDNRSLELMIRIKEIQQVTRSISELRNLVEKIAGALKEPDMQLIVSAKDWYDARTN